MKPSYDSLEDAKTLSRGPTCQLANDLRAFHSLTCIGKCLFRFHVDAFAISLRQAL